MDNEVITIKPGQSWEDNSGNVVTIGKRRPDEILLGERYPYYGYIMSKEVSPREYSRQGICYNDPFGCNRLVRLRGDSTSAISSPKLDFSRLVRIKGSSSDRETYMVIGRSLTCLNLLILQANDGTLSIASDEILENVPRGGWMNFYTTEGYSTRAMADEMADPGRVACVYIEHGEGID
jgi:hypothetical protein